VQRQFKDLILINNWTLSLAVIVAACIVSFMLFGYWWPYWRTADMDFWMVNDGWLVNDGAPQERFDHPGYLSILLLGYWYGLLHQLGLLDVHALSLVPPPAEAEHAWTAAVQAGRVLSLLLSLAFVLGFGALVRRLIGDWRVAVLATLFLAFSGGVATEARVLRTELVAGGLVIIALLILLNAARTPQTPWRPALVGLAALLATLGLTNKVQVIFLICALPLMVLPFGCASDDPALWWRRSRLAFPIAGLCGAVAILLAIAAAPLVAFGIANAAPTFPKPFLFGAYGIYQAGIAAWIVVAMLGFARRWRVAPAETLAAMGAVVAGIALGLLALELRYEPQNVIIVMNPLEKLAVFASDPAIGQGNLVSSLLHGIILVLTTRTFVFDSSARPDIFLEWMVIAATIYVWKAGDRRLALQVATLMVVAWGMDAIYAARSLGQQYFTLTDPLVIIAAAWLVAKAPALQAHKRAYQIGVALIVAHFVLGLSEPVKHTFQTSKPLLFCTERAVQPQHIESFSFCPAGA
jgi:hypothetical protein